MVELQLLSGKKTGQTSIRRSFPVRIGRSPDGDLPLDENGIWDQHAQLDIDSDEAIVLCSQGQALASLNGKPVQQAALRNGDEIELGSIKLQFWLSRSPQRGLRVREWLTWAGIAGICLGQVGLIYWLLH